MERGETNGFETYVDLDGGPTDTALPTMHERVGGNSGWFEVGWNRRGRERRIVDQDTDLNRLRSHVLLLEHTQKISYAFTKVKNTLSRLPVITKIFIIGN